MKKTLMTLLAMLVTLCSIGISNKNLDDKQFDGKLVFFINSTTNEASVIDLASLAPGSKYSQETIIVPSYWSFKKGGGSLGGGGGELGFSYTDYLAVEIGEKAFYGAEASNIVFDTDPSYEYAPHTQIIAHGGQSNIRIIRKQGLANMPNMKGTLTLPASLKALEASAVLLPDITKLVFLGTEPPECLTDGGNNPWTSAGFSTPADIEVLVPDGSLAKYKAKAGLGDYFTNIHAFYTVVFYDEDGVKVLQSSYLEAGETPVYNGTTPTKESDAQYTYTFAGWDKELAAVTGNATYTATYNKTLRKYPVVFYDEDGVKVLQSSDIEYGSTPVYNGTPPTKESDVQYTYTFAGWDKELAAVTGNATYTATYNKTLRKYTVVFYDEDGVTELQKKDWEYGTVPAYTGAEPAKAEDENYTYTFDGWDKTLSAVTGDDVYKATYKATAKTVTAVETPAAEEQEVQKTVDNGVLYIIRGGVRYDARGQRVAQ